MEPTDLEKYFSAADFTVFFALLTMSALIGMYFGYKDKNKKSIESYNFGDRNVSPLAVAVSMAVSFKSAITIIAFPVETYFHGIMLLWIVVGSSIGVTIGVVYFIPLIFRLQVKSIYEYLELRYSQLIRKLCSGIYVVKLVMYLGVTMYVPALALNSVTPLDLSWSIAVTSLICTFYTTLGGIKAVIWTDVLQGIIMVLGPLILVTKATADVGGSGAVIDAARKGRRLNFSNFYSDIRMRSSGAAYFIGFLALATDTSSFTQVYAQRYLSCKSVKAARWAGMLRLIPTSLFVTLAIANGLVMYAYYEGCDPFGAGYVIKKDQLTPRFAVEVFQPLPGLAGLFVAAAYSGTLSTVSSGINALAAITSQDFLYPCWPNLPISREPVIVKALTVFFGCLVTCVAYLISQLQYTIVQVSLGLLGVFRGPVFAVFIMGTMCPWSNEKGALAGIVVGGGFTAWCCIGRMFSDVSPRFTQTLPLTVDECYVNATSSTMNFHRFNTTMMTSTTSESLHHRSILDDSLYSISPYFYGPIGFLVGIVTILIVSGITGFNKPKEMKPELFVPLVDNERIFPKRVVKFFRFGVPTIKQPGEIIPLQKDSERDGIDRFL